MLFIQFFFLIQSYLESTILYSELGQSIILLLKHLVTFEQVCRYATNYMDFLYHNITLSFVPNA